MKTSVLKVRPLASCSHIAASEISNSGYLSQFSNDIGVANLQSEGTLVAARRSVTDGLSVAANATNGRRVAVQILKK